MIIEIKKNKKGITESGLFNVFIATLVYIFIIITYLYISEIINSFLLYCVLIMIPWVFGWLAEHYIIKFRRSK